MLYLPWRNETELLGSDQAYSSKFSDSDVQNIIEQNRAIFEPDADAITEAFELVKYNPRKHIHSYDSINDQEKADVQEEAINDQYPGESFNEQQLSDLDPVLSN